MKTQPNVLAVVAAVFVGGVMFMTGWLMAPIPAEPPYLVEWQPARPGKPRFEGKVLNGGVGTMQLLPGPTSQSAAAGGAVKSGALGVFAVMGPQTNGLAPLIVLSDLRGAEVTSLSVDGDEMAYRMSTRARRYGLRDPMIRVVGVLDSIAAGDTVNLSTAFVPRLGRCFQVATLAHCRIGFSGASGWALLADVRGLTPVKKAALDGIWLGLLAWPIGLLASPMVALGLSVALAWYGIIRLPVDTGVLPVSHLAAGIMFLAVCTAMLLRWRTQSAKQTSEPAATAEVELPD